MHLQETVLCTTAPLQPSSGPGSISLHDIQTGVILASFKQTSAARHCTAIYESRNTQGGVMLAAQPDKSILNVYNFQRDQINLKIVLPEKLSCIAVDSRGEFATGGTEQGRMYLWELATGILFNAWDAHYRKVNLVTFSNDGAGIISGSDDSGVSVWSVSRLLDEDVQNELPMPYCSLSDHTLPITDIVCGIGSFPVCRVLTSSVDHSVKLWDLSSKSLLTTFQFPQPILSLAWDISERFFFAASGDGSIHQINLFRQHESKFGGQVTEAIGGAGNRDTIHIDENTKKRLISVGQPISSLAISFTSSLLLVGTSEGTIFFYDIASHQQLRSISTHKGFSITSLLTILKPLDLVGHIGLDFRMGDAKDIIPVKPVLPFQRMRDAKAREMHDVTMSINGSCFNNEIGYTTEEILCDHAFFTTPSLLAPELSPDPISLKAKVEELELEVTILREQLGKAKGVNDVMWKTVVQRLVTQDRVKNTEPGNSTEESPTTWKRRKM